MTITITLPLFLVNEKNEMLMASWTILGTHKYRQTFRRVMGQGSWTLHRLWSLVREDAIISARVMHYVRHDLVPR